MKKLILLGILILSSCSKDEVIEYKANSCNCNKLIQQRVRVIDNNLQVISDTGWQQVGAGSVSTDIKNCSRNGEIVFNKTENNQNKIIDIRHILDCK